MYDNLKKLVKEGMGPAPHSFGYKPDYSAIDRDPAALGVALSPLAVGAAATAPAWAPAAAMAGAPIAQKIPEFWQRGSHAVQTGMHKASPMVQRGREIAQRGRETVQHVSQHPYHTAQMAAHKTKSMPSVFGDAAQEVVDSGGLEALPTLNDSW